MVRVSGGNPFASNAMRESDGMRSRAYSQTGSDGNGNEAGLKALSDKDIRSVTQITKDNLSYEFVNDMGDQQHNWDKDDWEKLGDMFK